MLRALSLHEPWASLMSVGAKTFETRGRVTKIRGDIAIHSALKVCPFESFSDGLLDVMNKVFPKAEPPLLYESLPRGHIVCVVNLWTCWPTETMRQRLTKMEYTCGDYTPGRFGWATRNLRRLQEPVPCRGHQGFWFLDNATEE